jgi:hypothetical protein
LVASSLGAKGETVLVAVVAGRVVVGVGKLRVGEEGTANKLHAVRYKIDNASTRRGKKLDLLLFLTHCQTAIAAPTNSSPILPITKTHFTIVNRGASESTTIVGCG